MNVTALELTPSGIRLLTGYVLEDNLYVEAALEGESLPMDEDGIPQEKETIASLKKLLEEAKEKVSDLGSFILLLPPYGFAQKRSSSLTQTSSSDGVICFQDFDNLSHMLKRGQTMEGKEAIYAAPAYFQTDYSKEVFEFPLGQKSENLTVVGDIHFLDEKIVRFGKHVMKSCSIKPYLTLVSSYAGFAFLNKFPFQDKYLVIDFSKKDSFLSLVNHHHLEMAKNITFGLYDLIDMSAKTLGVSEKRCEELLDMFGLEESAPLSFKTHEGFDMARIHSAFDSVIDNFISRIQREAGSLTEDTAIVFYGYGAKIRKLDQVLAGKFHLPVYNFSSSVIGARGRIYTNLLGGLYLSSFSYQQPKVTKKTSEGTLDGFHR